MSGMWQGPLISHLCHSVVWTSYDVYKITFIIKVKQIWNTSLLGQNGLPLNCFNILFWGRGQKTTHFEFLIKNDQLKVNINRYHKTVCTLYQCSYTEFAHWSILCKNCFKIGFLTYTVHFKLYYWKGKWYVTRFHCTNSGLTPAVSAKPRFLKFLECKEKSTYINI